jgi:hypothetical protein
MSIWINGYGNSCELADRVKERRNLYDRIDFCLFRSEAGGASANSRRVVHREQALHINIAFGTLAKVVPK